MRSAWRIRSAYRAGAALFTAQDPVGSLAAQFGAERELLLTVVLSPADLLGRLEVTAGAHAGAVAQLDRVVLGR